ncbi:MAG TPA: Na+/H+ antiporter NhaA, partial [Polyangiaceae bacterium]|nr:Na+/H+ antiporter NhaA [Polyangiaceae bacterium]
MPRVEPRALSATSSLPPEASTALLRVARVAVRPLERFLRIEAASGVLLLVAAAFALAWANSPWAANYLNLWHTPAGIRIGSFTFERTLEWVVNDCLMVIFFFVVGLEIRREIHQGELSEWRRAALPTAAALGGMLAPAGLYLLLAGSPATRSGWGVPMATDIAFAVGVLALLGKRVPPALRVLLLALAVIDDLGAIVVIALFYSSGLNLSGFLLAALGLAAILLLQRFAIRTKLVYFVAGFVVWAGIYRAGVHPTIAGVIVGLLTPVRAWFDTEGFLQTTRAELEHFERDPTLTSSPHELARALGQMNRARREVLSPAESLIGLLHPWVAFGVMPVFALANAGVMLSGGEAHRGDTSIISLAVAAGLVLGKPIGILLASWLMLRLRLGILPTGIDARHLLVLGVIAGIGFTMALFVAQLAFLEPSQMAAAKLGVLSASGASAVFGLALGRLLLPARFATSAAQSADD